MSVICSTIANGRLKMGASGPNVFTISFRYCTSVLFTAPTSGAVIIYAARKIIAPIIRVIQLARFS